MGDEMIRTVSSNCQSGALRLSGNPTRNPYANALAPVNTLPSEILTRIFSMLVDEIREHMEKSLYRDGMARSQHQRVAAWKYPDILAHVCSYWRKVAIQSRAIWGNIDITTLRPSISRFNSRAKVHIERAGQSLLDIYIYDVDPMEGDDYHSKRADPIPLLFPHSVRIRSISYRTNYFPLDPVCKSILSNCFSKSTGEILTKLALSQTTDYGDPGEMFPVTFIKPANMLSPGHSSAPGFIDGDDDGGQKEQEDNVLRLTVLEPQLEKILLGIMVLRCNEILPSWTSNAYRGLTELRLIGAGPGGSVIDEVHSVNMLKSSPNLRVFELDLVITNAAPMATIVHRGLVSLPRLEVLNLRWSWVDQTEIILRWLLPILNPLQLSITSEASDLDFSTSATKTFLSASNIAKLHTVAGQYDKGVGAYLPSNVHTLAVDFESILNAPFLLFGTTRLQLEVLYLLYGSYTIGHICQVLRVLSAQEVIFYGPRFSTSNQSVITALAEVCSSKVTILSAKDVNPIEDWELFAPRFN